MGQNSPLADGSAAADRTSLWMLMAAVGGIVVFGGAARLVEGGDPLIALPILITVGVLVVSAVFLVAFLLVDKLPTSPASSSSAAPRMRTEGRTVTDSTLAHTPG